jgi:hypothetical protein
MESILLASTITKVLGNFVRRKVREKRRVSFDHHTHGTRRISEITRKAHSEGKRVRAFALPNSEGAWEDALRNGVDIISVDDHQGFREFCKKKSKREKEGFF